MSVKRCFLLAHLHKRSKELLFFYKNTCAMFCVVVILSQLENDFKTKEEDTV